MNQNSLLRIRDLSKEEIMGILKDAQLFGVSHKDWQLPERKLIANLFLNRAPELISPSHLPSISLAAWSKIFLHREAAWRKVKHCMIRSGHLKVSGMKQS